MYISFVSALFIEAEWANLNKDVPEIKKSNIKIAGANKPYFTRLGIGLPETLFVSREKDKAYVGGDQVESTDGVHLEPTQEELGKFFPPLNQEPNRLPDENKVVSEVKSEAQQSIIAQPTPPSKAAPQASIQPPMQSSPAPPQLQTNLSPKEKTLEDLRASLSSGYIDNIDRIAATVISSIANYFGVIRKGTPDFVRHHVQSMATHQTAFYFLEDKRLIARFPEVVKFGWEVFRREIDEGHHAWAKDIEGLPVAWDTRNRVSHKVAKHFCFVWRGLGCLVPCDKGYNIFDVNETSVILIAANSTGPNAETFPAKISGQFIEINKSGLARMSTEKRKDNNSVQEVMLGILSVAYSHYSL
jgi:hypothetical protein